MPGSAAQSLVLDDSLWLSMVGLHEAGCAELLDRMLGVEQAARLTRACHEEYDRRVAQRLPLKVGARDLLQDLFDLGVPMAVATSTRGERARLKLASTGLDRYFSHVVTSSDVAQAKPAPDLYLLAAERLGIAPRDCIALEDSEYGVRAASAAGIRVIQVPDLVPASELSRSLATVVSSIGEARPLIESFLGMESSSALSAV
ncbi:MAG: HAD family phosphatase [Lysobacteraceae bacterium]|nr:MAG: HAD family phosphatase [Xanthomonadaceae bacterium]